MNSWIGQEIVSTQHCNNHCPNGAFVFIPCCNESAVFAMVPRRGVVKSRCLVVGERGMRLIINSHLCSNPQASQQKDECSFIFVWWRFWNLWFFSRTKTHPNYLLKKECVETVNVEKELFEAGLTKPGKVVRLTWFTLKQVFRFSDKKSSAQVMTKRETVHFNKPWETSGSFPVQSDAFGQESHWLFHAVRKEMIRFIWSIQIA